MDIEKINEFRKEMMGGFYKPMTQDDLGRILLQPHARLLTIEDWSGLVAMSFVYVVESLTRKALVFEEFIVDSTSREQGIGTKLMEKIVELAKAIKVDCIEGCTRENNEAAQRLYAKFGFQDRENLALRLWIK